MSVEVTECQDSLLYNTPLMNMACLSCSPTSVRYFLSGTSSIIAFISAIMAYAFDFLSSKFNFAFPLLCTTSPKYTSLSFLLIVLPCTFRSAHFSLFFPTCITLHLSYDSSSFFFNESIGHTIHCNGCGRTFSNSKNVINHF